jgi:hypothetical protein
VPKAHSRQLLHPGLARGLGGKFNRPSNGHWGCRHVRWVAMHHRVTSTRYESRECRPKQGDASGYRPSSQDIHRESALVRVVVLGNCRTGFPASAAPPLALRIVMVAMAVRGRANIAVSLRDTLLLSINRKSRVDSASQTPRSTAGPVDQHSRVIGCSLCRSLSQRCRGLLSSRVRRPRTGNR